MSLWDSIQAGARTAADATKVAAHKTKLRTDMMMIDRDISNRKKAFGVSMYDHVAPLSQSSDFYAATDDLTNILRPHLITAQKEIQALAAKRVKLKEDLAAAEAKRLGSFPNKAETVGEKMMNFGKVSAMHTSETKIKAEIAVLDHQIKGYKQKFGVDLYTTLAEAEDSRGYLPTDRQVRNIYDQTRSDIHRSETKKKQKEEELAMLGGGNASSSNLNASSSTMGNAGYGSNFGSGVSDPHDLTSDLTMDSNFSDNARGSYNNGSTAGSQTGSGYYGSSSNPYNSSNNNNNNSDGQIDFLS